MKTALRTISVILFMFVSMAVGAMSLSLSASMVSLPAMNPVTINTFSAVRGNFGEAMTDYDYLGRLANTGWKTITPRTAPQGLDHIALKFSADGILEDVLVVETKYTHKSVADALGDTVDGKQMSSSWVRERVRKDVVSLYEDYIASDNYVSVMDTIPEDAVKKVYIDNDSCYFTDSDGRKCFYSSSEEMRADSSRRTSRAQTTSDNLLRYAESSDIRRRIVKFEQDDNGALHRFLFEVTDGKTDSSRTVHCLQMEETIVSDESLSAVLNGTDYKEAVADLYNLNDTSVLDKLTDNQLLRLNRGLDAETAEIIFSSKNNSRQLALKLGLNEDTNFIQLGLTDAQIRKVTAASSIDDIDDADAVSRLRQRSNAATARQMGIHAGAAFGLGSVVNIFQQAGAYGWNNINLLEAGRVGLETAGVSVAKDAAEGVVNGLIRTSVKDVRKLAKVIRVTPFVIDVLFDVGEVTCRYFNGNYAYTSQAFAEGAINIAVDIGGGILAYAAMGAISSSVAGPAGTVIGFVAGLTISAAISFGSRYVVQPVSSALELQGFWGELDKNLSGSVTLWTREYLAQ